MLSIIETFDPPPAVEKNFTSYLSEPTLVDLNSKLRSFTVSFTANFAIITLFSVQGAGLQGAGMGKVNKSVKAPPPGTVRRKLSDTTGAAWEDIPVSRIMKTAGKTQDNLLSNALLTFSIMRPPIVWKWFNHHI
jgi:hypothetical protein